MKSSVELCINKVYDAAAKSELKANCEKFGSELGELGKRDYLTDSCVSSGMAFWKSAESFSEFTVPIHKRESGVDKPITAASLCFVSQEECQDATKIIEPKLDDTPCSFCRDHSTKEKILLSSKFLRIPGKMPKIYTYALSISGKCMARFLVKIFGGVTGVRCWLVPLAGRQVTVFLIRKLCPRRRVKSQLFSFGVRLWQWCVLALLLCLYQGLLHNGSRANSDLWSHFTLPQ